jgi:hypothetical protein
LPVAAVVPATLVEIEAADDCVTPSDHANFW